MKMTEKRIRCTQRKNGMTAPKGKRQDFGVVASGHETRRLVPARIVLPFLLLMYIGIILLATFQTPISSGQSFRRELPDSSFTTPVECQAPMTGNDVPVPVILVVTGRSGSTSTWYVMMNLTGGVSTKDELTGSNPKENEEFFRDHPTPEWIPQSLCAFQKKWPKNGIVGFHWKPFNLHDPGSKAGFNWIARHQAEYNIKVLRGFRNPLDVYLSNVKHDRSAGRISFLCSREDKECVNKHLLEGANMTVDVAAMKQNLKWARGRESHLDVLLSNISYCTVFYEGLHATEPAVAVAEWSKLFEYLGRGPTTNLIDGSLTMEMLQSAMTTAQTNTGSHRESIQNFDDVRQALKEMNQERWLRDG